MKVIAKLNNLRVSPRKARVVASVIKGMNVNDALVQLESAVKKSSPHLIALIKSAMANAQNNFSLDKNNLFVYDIQIGEGMKHKRWMPRAHGRATQIIKRGSNIILILDEIKIITRKEEKVSEKKLTKKEKIVEKKDKPKKSSK